MKITSKIIRTADGKIEKRCSHCKTWLGLEEFYNNKSKFAIADKDHLCKQCKKAHVLSNYHRKKIKKFIKEHKENGLTIEEIKIKHKEKLVNRIKAEKEVFSIEISKEEE